MFGHLMGWYTICIFGNSCRVTEFCHVQNSHCVQVLRSPVLGSSTVRQPNFAACDKELSLFVYAIYIPQGGHHVGHRPTLQVFKFFHLQIRQQIYTTIRAVTNTRAARLAFSALTLLVGRQEEYSACKKIKS